MTTLLEMWGHPNHVDLAIASVVVRKNGEKLSQGRLPTLGIEARSGDSGQNKRSAVGLIVKGRGAHDCDDTEHIRRTMRMMRMMRTTGCGRRRMMMNREASLRPNQ
jgi:hypothetical protein